MQKIQHKNEIWLCYSLPWTITRDNFRLFDMFLFQIPNRILYVSTYTFYHENNSRNQWPLRANLNLLICFWSCGKIWEVPFCNFVVKTPGDKRSINMLKTMNWWIEFRKRQIIIERIKFTNQNIRYTQIYFGVQPISNRVRLAILIAKCLCGKNILYLLGK